MRVRTGRSISAVLVAVAGLPWIPPVAAQSDASPLARCAAIADEAERLACYDDVARDRSAASPGQGDRARPGRAVSDPPATDAGAGGRIVELETEPMPADGAAVRADSWRERAERDQPFSVLVTERVENLSGLSVFVLEDGSIFDQISPREGRYPAPPFIASFEPATRNSFWLTTEAGGRAIRVMERD